MRQKMPKQNKKHTPTKPGVWGMGPAQSSVDLPGDAPLENTDFPLLVNIKITNSFLVRDGTQCPLAPLMLGLRHDYFQG